uniref:Helix-turn-helix XRE-family like protein n=1 Tax=Firmicutes phage HS18 TaxID=3056396 RepID=A0AA49X4K8_9VIRU|nr:MAG: helix-turn-helix XRE-family like protein [Firmicutes phage HS18]
MEKRRITLKAARVNVGLTQKEVADRIGVSETTIFNWENGKNKMPLEGLVKLANLYDMSIDDFLLPSKSI